MYRSGIYRNGTPLTYTEEVYMYRSGPNFEFGEKPVPKWYVPKWSCTELALTHNLNGMYRATQSPITLVAL